MKEENNKSINNEDDKCLDNSCLFFQIMLWILVAINILILIFFGSFGFVNIALGFLAFINYIIYFFLNVFIPLSIIIGNQLTDSEIINKIQNIINDNTFNDSTVQYECYHDLKVDEKRNENYKYIKLKNSTRVITKSGTMNYSFKSMRDISGKLYLNTQGYPNMRVDININIVMDKETKEDFDDNKEGFLIDFKNSDERFKSEIKHNYKNNRKSDKYLVKVNGGKCTCIFNDFLYWTFIFLGFAEIIKAIVRCHLNKEIQRINIEKIISSKYDYNDPDEAQKHGYDKLIPILYVNDKAPGNNSSVDLKVLTYDEKDENLIPK